MRALMLAALVACGPTAAEVKTAKTATYEVDSETMLRIAFDVTKETYPIEAVDEGNRFVATMPRFYSQEGDLESAGAGGWAQVAPGSVRVQFVVQVTTTDLKGQVAVTVTPKVFQLVQGSPKPRELKSDDPYMPPWVLGRADSLQLAIYERAKAYAR